MVYRNNRKVCFCSWNLPLPHTPKCMGLIGTIFSGVRSIRAGAVRSIDPGRVLMRWEAGGKDSAVCTGRYEGGVWGLLMVGSPMWPVSVLYH